MDGTWTLAPGDYVATTIIPEPGWLVTTPVDGSQTAALAASGETLTGIDFGHRQTAFGPIGPEFRVNSTVDGSQQTSTNVGTLSQTLAMDAAGNGVVVWAGNGPGDAPSITSSPVTVAAEGSLYTYNVDADVPDVGDSRTYSWVNPPVDMTINPTSGVIAWMPITGNHLMTVTVTDDGEPTLTDTQSYTLTVDAVSSELVYTSTGNPINIGDKKTVSSSINVSGTGLSVVTLTIQIDLTHASPDDLSARLINSNGFGVDIDESILSGNYEHKYVISGVTNQALDGTWTLQVTDSVKNRKRGSLIEWKMTVEPLSSLLADDTLGGSAGSQAFLTQQDAEYMATAAMGMWSQQVNVTAMPDLNVTVADLPAGTLGWACGNTITPSAGH